MFILYDVCTVTEIAYTDILFCIRFTPLRIYMC